jgi:transposase
MKFVATKTADQLDLQALHRVRERLVSQRTGIINQIRAFLLERGIAVRQGQRFLRAELPRTLATPPDVLSPRMVRIVEDLAGDGAGSTSGSRVCRTRSKPSRARMPVASG